MSLSTDLLEQASHLVDRDAARPRQANLRRAVSAAYYALFHLLCSEAAKMAAPANPPNLRLQVQRAFAHGDMKSACTGLISRPLNRVLVELIGAPSANLMFIARAFVELQDERHKADYDVASNFSRTEVKQRVGQCRQAFAAWRAVRGTDEANVFLAALLSQRRWDR